MSIGRKAVLGVLALASLPGGCSRRGSGERVVDGYNVLLVTLDTTRKSRLSCYGHPVQTSPHIDALAKDGVKFDLAIVQAGITPVSHASILTGLNPYSHGLRVIHAASGYKLSPLVPTLATVLRDAGWSTGAFLSSFTVSEHFGFAEGYDVFDPGIKGDSEGKFHPGPDGVWDWDVRANQRRSDETTDRAIRWIRKTRRPFYAWVHYWDPHDPALVPPEDVVRRFVSPGAVGIEQSVQLYDAEVFYMDSQFGRLLQAIKDIGEYDNTMIVVVADHGQGLDDGLKNHGWYLHSLLYQEQIDVPFILRVPGEPKGRVVSDLVRSIDIFPTVLDILKIPAPGPVEGASLCGLIAGRPELPRLAYADSLSLFDLNSELARERRETDLLYCAMDAQWKLIYHPRRPEKSELYNLKRDPKELTNFYSLKTEEAKRLLGELQRVNCFVDKPFEAKDDDEAARREALERLRALGYVGGPSTSPATQTSPRD